MRILVVEDEAAIAAFVTQGLAEAGYAVDLASDGAEALHWVAIAEYDLVMLDVMLPDRDGVSICREIRARGLHMPVLMVTARDTVDDRVAGLDSGADDYLIKPFAFAELLARVRALLRREPVFKGSVLEIADLTLDTIGHSVRRAGQPIALTSKEYSLLEFLMRHPNQTLSRTAIGEHVWNYDFDNVSNLIDVHIFGLRRKIDDPFELKLLHTVRGVGYRLGADPTP
jgi:heavy metal response regulator